MLSNALMKFQILHGFFPRVIGKGDGAQLLAEVMDRARIEYFTNTGIHMNDSQAEFDSVFLFDRTVDLLTPMKTQLTYEGLIDEYYNIKSCKHSLTKLSSKWIPVFSVILKALQRQYMRNQKRFC